MHLPPTQSDQLSRSPFPRVRWFRYHGIEDRCFIRSSPGHEEPHWVLFDSRNESPNLGVPITEDQHKKFNWIWIGWCWWLYQLCGMDQPILQVSSKDLSNWAFTKRVREEEPSQARQYEYHQDGEGRPKGLWDKNKKHSYSIFLCDRKSEGWKYCCNILSNKRDGSWLPFQTITR